MGSSFVLLSAIIIEIIALAAYFDSKWLWAGVAVGPVILIGLHDVFQKKHAILRNFPIVGHFRYLLEAIRPEVNQYFIESNSDGMPFSREQRSIVYQRAKNELETLPFGTQKDTYEVGYEWVKHSMVPKKVDSSGLRKLIGGSQCTQPYSASLLNISAMSYGSLSKNAILALNGGAKDGNFAHNTGEGGISSYHKKPGGDLIWQIGTGYFGCRTPEGQFNEELFGKNSQLDAVKMIEIKISQGAKPGHGGILPKHKVTKEIAEIRSVPMGEDVISPPGHTAFSTPIELLQFIDKLRTLSGGKPVGFKFAVGKLHEFFSICKAMHETKIYPDYIAVDGGEGGTGAAPLEFSNHVGAPGLDALAFVHDALVGFDLKKNISIMASSKVTTAFGMIKLLAMGADTVYSARAMMMALGCIQALRCHANTCPTGVATQDPSLYRGLVVGDKRTRVQRFHESTLSSASRILGAMGLTSVDQIKPWHIVRRVAPGVVKQYSSLYRTVEPGVFLGSNIPEHYKTPFDKSSPERF